MASPIWNVGGDACTPEQGAEMVRTTCTFCADVYGALQAPADAVYAWLDSVRCKIFKKLDKAGDKAVIRVLEQAYSIRDLLGATGPAYPGIGGALGVVPAIEPDEDVPALAVADCAAPDVANVHTSGAGSPAPADGKLFTGGVLLDADFDRPHVYQFGERSAPWHQAVAAFYEFTLDPLLDAPTWRDYQAKRDSEVASMLTADPPEWSSTFDSRPKE